ncbi:MAG: glutaminase [Bacteroidota bacterium]
MKAEIDYSSLLSEIHSEIRPMLGSGEVADYIPALSRIDPKKFSMAVQTIDGKLYHTGDSNENFSIQSISKVFTLTLALKLGGESIWDRVGREPSGNAFNSLIQLEYEQGVPRNPFINAGALVVSDHIITCTGSKEAAKSAILEFMQTECCHKRIQFDPEVADSEKITGYRNAAMANFLKSFNRLNNDVEDVLDVYFHQCSVAMNCIDLCNSSLFLANRGVSLVTGQKIVSPQKAKRINSVMLTCGLYDAVGDFAFHVGLPAKSGVGGGIIAVVPNEMVICVWSPPLNPSGNSCAGTEALELFTNKTECSIF